jgi:hypothetical protein
MYFVLIVGALHLIRWIACASGSLRSIKLHAPEGSIVRHEGGAIPHEP